MSKVDPSLETVAIGTGSFPADGDGDDSTDVDEVEYWGPPGVSRRVRITALVLTLLGLADSIYLTVAHYQANLLSVTCAQNSVINCQKVTTSPQSEILHIPVAVLGLAFYLALTTVNLPRMWRSTDVRIAWLRLAMMVSGMGFVLYLLYAELFLIKAICEYCTGVHLITFALFVLTVVTLPSMVQPRYVGGDEEPDT